MIYLHLFYFFFFFNDTATTEIYTLSLHDALPISEKRYIIESTGNGAAWIDYDNDRSEEHTSELQSLAYLVCRLLLEKKKKKINEVILSRHENNSARKGASPTYRLATTRECMTCSV